VGRAGWQSSTTVSQDHFSVSFRTTPIVVPNHRYCHSDFYDFTRERDVYRARLVLAPLGLIESYEESWRHLQPQRFLVRLGMTVEDGRNDSGAPILMTQ
jgi:hypothetical protein